MRFVYAAARVCAALALTAGVASSSLAQVNLVQNGGFELTNGGGSPAGYGQPGSNGLILTDWSNSGYNFLFNASNAITGVVGSDGSLALWGIGNGGFDPIVPSPAGGNFMANDGAYEQGPISQTIHGLTIGHSYTLGFYDAAAQQTGFTGDTTESWTVSLGSDLNVTTPTFSNPSMNFQFWQPEAYTFTANATSEVLSFLANGTPTGEPPFSLLDGVSIYDNTPPPPTTPEPGSMASIFAGVFAIGTAVRRRIRN